ncbi:MAG TPA: precorrin-3B C(17)-methyltransferase [Actinomycetes bacterium]|nr:precorrin-3B C(17)-methyltransferase [Actinomycetes bacterium]
MTAAGGGAAGAPRVTVIAAAAPGRRNAEHLARALPGACLATGRPARAVGDAWAPGVALVLCMATGAAVRLIAPHLAGKDRDPAVVAVDDAGAFAVALLGGHAGANALAGEVAAALGAQPVVTTASEALGLPALDRLGEPLGLRLDPASRGAAAAVGGALLAGATLHRWRARPWPTGPLPGSVREAATPAAPGIAVTDELVELPSPCLVYRPAALVVGVGAARGVTAEEVGGLIDDALAGARLSPLAVAHLATVDRKAHEPGILAAAAERGWRLVAHPAELLARVAVPNPSERVRAAIGIASVAEAAALVEGGELLVAKRASAAATVAVARRPVRGRLALVSTGPGDPALVPPLAREALAAAEVAIGLDQYLERARRWLRPGCRVVASPVGQETARAEHAVAAARGGASVALVSGGDVGVYAMASPALERAGTDVDVLVVPGVTAAQAAAALLGSPLGHDHCAISLSDLLTPWPVIRRRIEAAAEADFVVSLYNPRSRARHWQLEQARRLLLARRAPGTPVGVVTDAFRPRQQVTQTTLAELDPGQVGMFSIVIVGAGGTRVLAGRMVTPRGSGGPEPQAGPPVDRGSGGPEPQAGPPVARGSGGKGAGCAGSP